MAFQNRVFLLLFISSLIYTILALPPNQSDEIPFTCLKQSKPYNSILYQNNDLSEENISALYSVDMSQIQTVGQGDHLVTVPCSCQNVNNTVAYFYDTIYRVKRYDTFLDVSDEFYSGQAWDSGDKGTNFTANTNATMYLLCGCVQTDDKVMVTYTVEQHDTLSDIANRLSAEVSEIESVNKVLIQKPGFIEAGWVLFVPMYKNGVPALKSNKGKNKDHKWEILFGVLLSVIALLVCRGLDFSKNVFNDRTVIVCDQCEREYHIGCLRERNMADLKALPKGKWFCSTDCDRIRSVLNNLLTREPEILPDDFSQGETKG